MSNNHENSYDILGVNADASLTEIKSAYRNLAKKYHPDKYDDNPLRGLAESKMRQINAAYSTISKDSSAYSSDDKYGEQAEYEYSSDYTEGFGGNGGNGSASAIVRRWPVYYYIMIGIIIVLLAFGVIITKLLTADNSMQYLNDDIYSYGEDGSGYYGEEDYGYGYPENDGYGYSEEDTYGYPGQENPEEYGYPNDGSGMSPYGEGYDEDGSGDGSAIPEDSTDV